MGDTYLIVDTRESHVLPHIVTEFGAAGVRHVVAQINTGDYMICRRVAGEAPEVLCVVERKTLPDYAASLCDGRHENRHKLLDMRDRTGCQLYYFIEGPAYPSPQRKFGRVPYRTIQAAITSLTIRDGITAVQTETVAHTAQRLLAFVQTFAATPFPYRPAPAAARIAGAGEAMEAAGEAAAGEAPGAAGEGPGAAGEAAAGEAAAGEDMPGDVPAGLTGLIEKSDGLLAAEIWARLPGISLATAGGLVRRFSVADLATGRVSAAALAEVRTPSGRALHKTGAQSLARLGQGGALEAHRVLTGVPGISADMARQVLAGGGLGPRLALTAGALAATPLQQKNRAVQLGPVRAGRIWRLFHHKGPDEGPGPPEP